MIENLKFDKNGLIPTIVQDYYTKKVLTLAYMNKESLAISIAEKKTCFFSRSRQKIWRKGDTSGNYQHIVSIKADCDNDALLIEAIKDGPACHLGTDSCFNEAFFFNEEINQFSFDGLYNLIMGRKTEKKEGSYTTYLFDKGLDKILKKVGEESTEVVIAAKNNDQKELVFEISDLLYHVMVLMAEKGLSINDIVDELAKRHVIDKKNKQEYMK
jgi:phosphoribosyl-ATP pyrophosphohydrolase/phosphoribosyl-AMP cyclohydrolase